MISFKERCGILITRAQKIPTHWRALFAVQGVFTLLAMKMRVDAIDNARRIEAAKKEMDDATSQKVVPEQQ